MQGVFSRDLVAIYFAGENKTQMTALVLLLNANCANSEHVGAKSRVCKKCKTQRLNTFIAQSFNMPPPRKH